MKPKVSTNTDDLVRALRWFALVARNAPAHAGARQNANTPLAKTGASNRKGRA